MQTNYFSPEMQLWPIKHKRKDAHSTHCMRRGKKCTQAFVACSAPSHFISPPSKLQHKSRRSSGKDWSKTQDQDFSATSSPVSLTVKWKIKIQE